MGGDEHNADASNIHREFEFQNIRALCLKSPGLHKEYGGIETVVLAGVLYGVLVTADSGKRGEFRSISAYYLVIEIPSLDTKGFGPEHPAPGIRGLEGGEIQKAFVHYGKSVGHRLSVLFGYLYRKLFLWVKDIRN